MAVLASPTPGKITLSAFSISLHIVGNMASMPILSSAYNTDWILPALYLTIVRLNCTG